jgi:hypothetical protein
MKNFLKGLAFLAALGLAGTVSAQTFNPTATSQLRFNSSQSATEALLRGPSTKWSYDSPTGGITTATSVTIKAAVAGHNQHLKAISFGNSGAAGTEVVVNCGAAGTVMYRGWVGPTSTLTREFPYPRSCPAGNLIEVVTVSGTTIAVRVDAGGYTD